MHKKILISIFLILSFIRIQLSAENLPVLWTDASKIPLADENISISIPVNIDNLMDCYKIILSIQYDTSLFKISTFNQGPMILPLNKAVSQTENNTGVQIIIDLNNNLSGSGNLGIIVLSRISSALSYGQINFNYRI